MPLGGPVKSWDYNGAHYDDWNSTCTIHDNELPGELQSSEYQAELARLAELAKKTKTDRIAIKAREAVNQTAVEVQAKANTDQIKLIKAHNTRMIEMVEMKHAKEMQNLKAVIAILCFPYDTPISIPGESSMGYRTIPISEIQVGDDVISRNLEQETGKCEVKKVQHLTSSRTDRLVRISFQGKVVKATENHPFFVQRKEGWVEARDLRVGDELQTISGESVPIEEIEIEEGEFDVYNLDVEGNHNYYACDVLVHNCTVIVATVAGLLVNQ